MYILLVMKLWPREWVSVIAFALEKRNKTPVGFLFPFLFLSQRFMLLSLDLAGEAFKANG